MRTGGLPLLAGPEADQLSLLALAVSGAAFVYLLMRRAPAVGFSLWLVSVCFVPYWFSLNLVVDVPPASLVGLLLIAAWFPPRLTGLSLADATVVFLIVLTVLPMAIGAGSLATAFVGVAHWGLGYLLGRLVLEWLPVQWVYGSIAVVFCVVAALAVVEFAAGWNPFVGLARANSAYLIWGKLQERGGVVRAEWAFGHSIALGASLALAIPVTLAAPFRAPIRAAMVLLMLAGATVTFSRIGIGCAILGAALAAAFIADGVPRRLRIGILALLATGGALLFSRVVGVFVSAGTEAAGSAAYRLNLRELLPSMQLVGISDQARVDASGALSFGAFRSIDSALLLMGLTYGVFALGLSIALLVACLLTLLRGHATPATVAVAAQIPALLSVALITQYAMFFWFMVGLAVATQVRRAGIDHGQLRPGVLQSRVLALD